MDSPGRPQPTSMRFHADELTLIDAIAAHHQATKGGKWSRTETVRQLLRRLTPPGDPSETASAWRRAYKRVFPGSEVRS